MFTGLWEHEQYQNLLFARFTRHISKQASAIWRARRMSQGQGCHAVQSLSSPSPTKMFHKQQNQQSLFLCVFASSVPYIPFTSGFRGFLYPQIVWPSEGSSGAWCEGTDLLTGHLAVASWSRLLLPFSSAEVLIWILLLSQTASFQ